MSLALRGGVEDGNAAIAPSVLALTVFPVPGERAERGTAYSFPISVSAVRRRPASRSKFFTASS